MHADKPNKAAPCGTFHVLICVHLRFLFLANRVSLDDKVLYGPSHPD